MVVIQFSDDETLRLSKRYGLLEGPSLDNYLNGRNCRRHLTLTALPERHLGTAVTGALAVFDYQPGDVFQHTSRNYAGGFGGTSIWCGQSWWQDSVVARQTSRTGDTLTYTVRTWQRSESYGTAGAPSGFCSTPSGVTVGPTTTHTERIIGSQQGSYGVQVLTSFFPTYAGAFAQLCMSVAARSSTRLAGRCEYTQFMQANCLGTSPDSVALTNPVDVGGFNRYATGLGLTYAGSTGIYSSDATELTLTAFRKGSQTWGTFFPKGYLLAARSQRPAATTTAYPNPFGDGLTAAFTLGGAQAVSATLHDALGRAVRTAPSVALGAGTQQLALPTAGLPAGVYSLHLHFGADDHTEVLRVTKAE